MLATFECLLSRRPRSANGDPPALGHVRRSCPELSWPSSIANCSSIPPPPPPSSHLPPSLPSLPHSSDFFLDDCPALLQQVPDTFDLGLTPVQLCSVAASPSYLAIGSQCGALFLFNRRLGQSVKPLRTNYTEVVHLLQFHSPALPHCRDQLAVGHQSGTICLLALPSEQNPRLSQHVQEEAHRGSPLSAICWSSDGGALFSGDQSGLVLAIRADFANEKFPVDFVASEPAPISAMATAGDGLLAFSSGTKCKIVNWRRDYEPIAVADFGQEQILELAFGGGGGRGHWLNLLKRANGKLVALRVKGGGADGKAGQVEEEELGNIWTNLTEEQRSKWTQAHFADAKAATDPTGQTMALWKGALLLICRLWGNAFGMELVDLAERMDQPNLQVISICAPNPAEFFLLTRCPRRILRLDRHSPAPPALTTTPPPSDPIQKIPSNVFGSLLVAGRTVGGELQRAGRRRAQELLPTRTEELLGKLNRELDVFLMGDGAMKREEEGGGEGRGRQEGGAETGRLAERLAAGFLTLPEPERLTQGFQQVMGQIRQQSSSLLSSELDYWSMAGTSRTEANFEWRHRRDSSANRSLPTEFSGSMADEEDREELISMLGEEGDQKREKGEEVRVKRRRRRKGIGGRRKMEGRGGGGLRALVEERTSKASSALDLEASDGMGEMEEEEEAMDEQREWQIMNVLNKIMQNDGEEGEEEAKGRKEAGWIEEEEVKEEEGQLDMQGVVEEDDEMPVENGGGEGMAAKNDKVRCMQQPTASANVLDLSDLLADVPPLVPPRQHHVPSPPSSRPSSSLLQHPSIHPSSLYRNCLRRMANGHQQEQYWSRLDAPFAIGHFAICRHYLVICPKRRAAHRAHFMMAGALARSRCKGIGGGGSPEKTQGTHWSPLRVHADAIVPNESGIRIWRLCNGIGYSPAITPDPIGPSASFSKCAEWCEMTSPNEGKLLQVAMTSRHAWYLTDRGIFVQMCLPETGIGIWFRAHGEEEDHGPPTQFGQIAASDGAVWALNSFTGMISVRTGLRHCPMGVDWAEMDRQPRKFASLAIFQRTGFGLDTQGALWFIHSVAPESPFGVGPWHKIPPISVAGTTGYSPSKCLPFSEWRLQVGVAGCFVNVGPALFHAAPSLVGCSFEHVVPDRLIHLDHFALLAAGAFSGPANDRLFCCAPSTGDLLALSLRSRAFSHLPLPSSPLPNIRSIWASSEWLFLLDQSGLVHSRRICFNSAGNGAEGEGWTRFGQPAKFVSIAVSSASIWAISQQPNFAIWASRFRPVDGLDRLDWMEIAGPSQETAKGKADQVRISPSGQSLWVFSSASGIGWARTDLSARNWRGRSWVQGNDGVRLLDLAVADSAVWALAKGGGQLHWMAPHPAAQSMPPIWRPLDFRLNAISVDSLEERLWALDTEFRLVRQELDIFPREEAEKEEAEGNAIAETDNNQLLQKAREMPERTLSGASVDSWCDMGR